MNTRLENNEERLDRLGDQWFAAPGCEGEWTVYDENRLPVAYCGDRREDAETIVRDHNAFGELLGALRDLLSWSAAREGTKTVENLKGIMASHERARAAIAKVEDAS